MAVVGSVCLVVGGSVLAWSTRRRSSLIPFNVITNAAVLRSAVGAASAPTAWFGLMVAMPHFLADRGWELWQIGLAFAPSGVTGLLTPRTLGRLTERWPAAALLQLSAAIAIAMVVGASTGIHLGSPTIAISATSLVTAAFSLGHPAMAVAVTHAVDEGDRGTALGLATLVFFLGGSVGSAIISGLTEIIGLAQSTSLVALVGLIGAWLVAAELIPNDLGSSG